MGTKHDEDDVFIKPKIPFCEPTSGHGLKLGTSIVVYGRILFTSQMLKTTEQNKMFELKLMSNQVNNKNSNNNSKNKSKEVIPLAMEVNVGQSSKVTLNSFAENKWNKEVNYSDNVPFVVDRNFELIIHVDSSGYQLAVNGIHCYRYKHIAPFDKVDHLFIGGNVEIDKIQFNKKTK